MMREIRSHARDEKRERLPKQDGKTPYCLHNDGTMKSHF